MNQANFVEGDKRTERVGEQKTGELRGWENREGGRTERVGEQKTGELKMGQLRGRRTENKEDGRTERIEKMKEVREQ